MRTIIFFPLFFVVMSCSAGRKTYTYQLCVEKPVDESVLIKDRLIGTSGEKFAVISGKAFAKSTSEPAIEAIVVFRDLKSGNAFSSNTNFDGEFSINLPPSLYQVSITTSDYSPFSKQMTINAGEKRNLEISLGDLRSFVSYEIKSRKKLTEEDLDKAEQELRAN